MTVEQALKDLALYWRPYSPKEEAAIALRDEVKRLMSLQGEESGHLMDLLTAAEADRDRYHEDRNLEKQMRKRAEGQREAFREVIQNIMTQVQAGTPHCVVYSLCREALKEQP